MIENQKISPARAVLAAVLKKAEAQGISNCDEAFAAGFLAAMVGTLATGDRRQVAAIRERAKELLAYGGAS